MNKTRIDLATKVVDGIFLSFDSKMSKDVMINAVAGSLPEVRDFGEMLRTYVSGDDDDCNLHGRSDIAWKDTFIDLVLSRVKDDISVAEPQIENAGPVATTAVDAARLFESMSENMRRKRDIGYDPEDLEVMAKRLRGHIKLENAGQKTEPPKDAGQQSGDLMPSRLKMQVGTTSIAQKLRSFTAPPGSELRIWLDRAADRLILQQDTLDAYEKIRQVDGLGRTWDDTFKKVHPLAEQLARSCLVGMDNCINALHGVKNGPNLHETRQKYLATLVNLRRKYAEVHGLDKVFPGNAGVDETPTKDAEKQSDRGMFDTVEKLFDTVGTSLTADQKMEAIQFLAFLRMKNTLRDLAHLAVDGPRVEKKT